MSKKALVGVSCVAALALGLAACSSDGGDDENVTLRWAMSADSQAEVEVWEHLADMVTEKYPNITVKFESAPFGDFYNKLTTQAAGNDLPDISGLVGQRVNDVGSLFIDLEPYFASTDFNLADYDPAMVAGLKTEAGQLAIPYDLGPIIMFYNKDMFEEAGLELPSLDWTFEEFLADAEALTTDDHFGYAVQAGQWFPWALSQGGQYEKDGTPTMTDPGIVAGFQTEVDLVTKYHVADAPGASGTGGGAGDLWRSGRAAMAMDGPWSIINARDNIDFEMGLTTIPSIDGKSITMMAGTGFGITSTSEHPEEAWKAISVIIGPEAQKYIADAGRGYPAYIEARPEYYQTVGVDGTQEALETALATADSWQTPAGWQQVTSLLDQYAPEAFAGTKSAQEVLETIQAQLK